MDNDDQKKYTILENTLQLLNKKYISLPEDETKRNNNFLKIIDQIIQKMRSKNPLFDALYEQKYYGGSFYDGLKVGKPSEYDLDCLLSLPKAAEATVIPSDRPGFVHVSLNLKALEAKPDEATKYAGLSKLMDGKNLSAEKVKSWMEGLMASVLPEKSPNVFSIKIDTTTHQLQAKYRKSGPALTIKLQGKIDGKEVDLDVDLVPCFKFFDEKWPGGGCRRNPSQVKNTFFVVPKTPKAIKTPKASDSIYWRLSFQEQEKELLSGYAVMKPTIRLLKKIRDRYNHKVASYYIKTVFLWELEKNDKSLWTKSLSYVFVTMLKKYTEYIAEKKIPYYWNSDYNLINDIPEITASCIANTLKKIASDIEKLCSSAEPYGILKYFLADNEYNIEVFKLEAPLGKKQMRKVRNKSADNLRVPSPHTSASSSFEDITKAVSSSSKIEELCLNLVSEQKCIVELLVKANEGIDRLENRVNQLNQEVEEQKEDRKELLKLVQKLNKEIDLMKKQKEGSSVNHLDFLLAGNDILKRTADFHPPH